MTRTPYLIQRLKKPFPIKEDETEQSNMFKKLANAFSFGGGLVNGGISKKAMEHLQKIWRYDYMGSAEFEWGAVPESLERMAKNNKKLTFGQVKVTAKDYVWSETKRTAKEVKEATVFYVCLKEIENEVRNWILILADETRKNFHTKERVSLASNLLGEKYNEDLAGWHDINNDFLFFTDFEMCTKFCELFEVKIKEPASS